MTRSTIIGFAGLAGSGKDTAAETLRIALESKGQIVQITSFAHPIREICLKVGIDPYNRETKELDVTRSYAHFELTLIEAITSELGELLGEDDLADLYATFVTVLRDQGYLVTKRRDELTISPRRFCQLLGTEGGRAVRTSLWNDILLTRVKRSCALNKKLAPDYVLVTDVRFPDERLPIDELIAIDRKGVDTVCTHASETHFGELYLYAQYQVQNNGTLAEFEQQITQLAEDFV